MLSARERYTLIQNGARVDPRPFQVLTEQERDRALAEAALLAPQILSPPWVARKYFRVGLYLLHEYGILCPQVRDLFSAGASARRAFHRFGCTQEEFNALNSRLGEMSRELAARVRERSAPRTARIPGALVWCLLRLEPQMRQAAENLSSELFEIYWGSRPEPDTAMERLKLWVAYADQCARYWQPSEILFHGIVLQNDSAADIDVENVAQPSSGRPWLRLLS